MIKLWLSPFTLSDSVSSTAVGEDLDASERKDRVLRPRAPNPCSSSIFLTSSIDGGSGGLAVSLDVLVAWTVRSTIDRDN